MNLLLQRYSDNLESTLGLMFDMTTQFARFQCYTLEDEHRDVKVKGETRIPAGRYELKLRECDTPMTKKYRKKYPWFKYHIEIMDVATHSYCYLHVGNRDSHTDGCVLLGNSVNNNTNDSGFLGDSASAFEKLYKKIVPKLVAKKQCYIEIRDEEFFE